MKFKLFSNVDFYELAPEVVSSKEKGFNAKEVWLDTDNKQIILHTDNGVYNVVFNNYNELLYVIVRLGRAIFFNDMIKSLNQAIDDLLYYRSCDLLEMTEDLTRPLIEEIEKTKERILKGNFKIMIRVGSLTPEHFDKFINSSPEAKKAVKDAVEKYREMCWETYEDDDPDYCDKVVPTVFAVVYAIPEEKSIMIKLDVDEIGEVYRVTNRYENADDFFKALEGYEYIII